MKRASLIASTLLSLALVVAWPSAHGAPAPGVPSPHGPDLPALDRTVPPSRDFYQFANGGWLASHSIPGDRPRWGRFDELREKSQQLLKAIVERAAAPSGATRSENERRIGDFYATGMDEAAVEKAGLAPLSPELAAIARVGDARALTEVLARLHRMQVGVAFDFSSDQDMKDSTRVIGVLSMSGLGLPDRDYYLKDDARSTTIREEYRKHVARMLELSGMPAAEAAPAAEHVVAFETRLAKASLSRVERRDPYKCYHMTSLEALRKSTPHVDWTRYFQLVSAPAQTSVNVAQPAFLAEVDRMIADVPLADWKAYLRWHLVSSYSPCLPERFVKEAFAFRGVVLTGVKEMRPRWKRVLDVTESAMGEALGEVYVREHFPPRAKAKVQQMVANLREALRADIKQLSWMGAATKKQALAKLDSFMPKLGYPDKWRDYSGLRVDRGSFALNVKRAREFESDRQIRKIGRPVDRGEWLMTPQTVNAYYNPPLNEIVFPAAILQPPFFDPDADDAVNYGGIGAVIGHEMTHGFDDEGCKYDAQGNLRNWWTPEDRKRFEELGDGIVRQYSAFKVDDLHLNGQLVEGEAIADLGGLTLAYLAYHQSLQGRPTPPVIDGFTADQRFFLGFGQIWATQARPEYARMLVTVDPHPPGRYRVLGTLSNMPAFLQAFSCKEGDPMWRPEKERCRIW